MNNQIREYLGPFAGYGIIKDRKLICVDVDGGNLSKAFDIIQVRKYFPAKSQPNLFFDDFWQIYLTFELIDSTLTRNERISLLRFSSKATIQKIRKEMMASQRSEIQSLMHRETFKIIRKNEISDNDNAFSLKICTRNQNLRRYNKTQGSFCAWRTKRCNEKLLCLSFTKHSTANSSAYSYAGSSS